MLEVQQIARSQARVFILVSGNLSSQDTVNIFVNCIGKIEKTIERKKRLETLGYLPKPIQLL